MSRWFAAVLLSVLAVTTTGCAGFGFSHSTPQKPADSKAVVFAQPVAGVRNAAMAALTANGFDIRKDEPLYIEGHRPVKIGFLIGSGGESAGIWLEAEGAGTRVWVSTAKSLLAYLGQKNWDDEILAEMRKAASEGSGASGGE